MIVSLGLVTESDINAHGIMPNLTDYWKTSFGQALKAKYIKIHILQSSESKANITDVAFSHRTIEHHTYS